MTERRRFFPAKRVQQTPGQTVKLDMQLHPLSKPVGGDCQCDVDGVAWFSDWYSPIEFPQNQWRNASASSVTGTAQGMQEPEGSPWRLGGRLVGAYTHIAPPGEAEVIPALWRATVLGRTLCDIKWTWTLDVPPFESIEGFGPPWWDGIEVTELAGSLLVRVGDGYDYPWDGPPWWAEFSATATCSGEPVGTLLLRPGFNLWNTDVGLPPIP